MSDNYDYFGDDGYNLQDSNVDTKDTGEGYSITDKPIQYIPRDRLVSRQTYSQNQVVQGQNKSIVLNDGKVDRLILGYAKDAF